MGEIDDIWVYLAQKPLLHLTLTLIAYQIGLAVYRRFRMSPLLNPVLIAVILLVTMLTVTKTDYRTYFEGAQFVHFLLGPATVALALPLYRQFERVKRSAAALGASLIVGSIAAAASAAAVAWALGASDEAIRSIASKSATAPVAMAVTEQLGGLPSLTAVLVIITGVIGAMIGPKLLTLLHVRSYPARGFAMGLASHGIGTARAMQVNEIAGAFSGLAMGLNALATAILVPLLWRLFVE